MEKEMRRALRSIADDDENPYVRFVVDTTFAIVSQGNNVIDSLLTIRKEKPRMEDRNVCGRECCASCYYKDTCLVIAEECDKDCAKCGYEIQEGECGFIPKDEK